MEPAEPVENPSVKELQEAAHGIRTQIDACIKSAQSYASDLARGPGGRECAISITKLQEAKMWMGKVLESLGSKLPEQYRDEAKQ